MTAQARVPGKLYIAGEYAVLRPGGAAILVAVDRTITARVRTGIAGDPGTGTITSEVTGSVPVPWRFRGTAVDLVEASTEGAAASEPASTRTSTTGSPSGSIPESSGRGAPDRTGGGAAGRTVHVRSAIAVAQRYADEHGAPDTPVALDLISEMTDGGRKLGLGSSGAVTVATVAALLAARGIETTPELVYRLAMLAAVALDTRGSGGDLAAASHGGWIYYRSPDRELLRRRLDSGESLTGLVASPWPDHTVQPLPAPATVRLAVGWTGSPASTDAQVSRMHTAESSGDAPSDFYGDFHADSDACVEAMAAALRRGDDAAFTAGISRARGLLATLADRTGMGIVTDELAALCRSADALGAAAKSSGAGGGDCGIAFVDSDAQLSRLEAAWREAGVRPLALQVFDDPAEVAP